MTQTQKEATAIHISTATNAAVTHYELTAPQAIDPVGVNTPGQSQQSASGSTLPNTGLFHPSQEATGLRGAVEGNNGGTDPGKKGDNAEISVGDINGLRNFMLDALDPSKNHDPSKGGPQDDTTGGGLSQERLRAEQGSSSSSNDTGETGGSSGKGGEGNREESMVGSIVGQPIFFSGDMLRSDGEWHAVQVFNSDQGITTVVDYIKTATADKNGSHYKEVSETIIDSNSNTETTTYADGSTKTTKNGKVVDTTTPSKSIPDGDQPTSSDPSLTKEAKAAAEHEHPRHSGDNTNVVGSDIPGTVSTVDLKGVAIGGKENLIANPGTADTAGGVIGSGHVPSPTNGSVINDLNATTQGTGPEQHAQPAVQAGSVVPAHPAQQGNGGDQSGSDSHDVSQVVGAASKTATQHAAQDLVSAVAPSHADSTAKTAQSVDGVHSGHDIASVLGGTVSAHDIGGFADLIRLAQNPAQSGLAPPPASVSHDAIAALQLSALGDLSGHGGDAHHVDDVHAAAAIALPAIAHEDHSHLTVAAIDHGHATH